MKLLLIIGSILVLAPIFGLFGTVISMIQVFNEVSIMGEGNAEELSRGISTALVTTQVGILIGPIGVMTLIIAHILVFRKEPEQEQESEKEYIVCMLLNLFLGIIGAHHFYAGRAWLGIAYIFTLGGFVVGQYSDFIMLAWGKFNDSEGQRIRYKSAKRGKSEHSSTI